MARKGARSKCSRYERRASSAEPRAGEREQWRAREEASSGAAARDAMCTAQTRPPPRQAHVRAKCSAVLQAPRISALCPQGRRPSRAERVLSPVRSSLLPLRSGVLEVQRSVLCSARRQRAHYRHARPPRAPRPPSARIAGASALRSRVYGAVVCLRAQRGRFSRCGSFAVRLCVTLARSVRHGVWRAGTDISRAI